MLYVDLFAKKNLKSLPLLLISYTWLKLKTLLLYAIFTLITVMNMSMMSFVVNSPIRTFSNNLLVCTPLNKMALRNTRTAPSCLLSDVFFMGLGWMYPNTFGIWLSLQLHSFLILLLVGPYKVKHIFIYFSLILFFFLSFLGYLGIPVLSIIVFQLHLPCSVTISLL